MSTEVILAFVAVIGLLVGAANVFGTFRVSRNTAAVSAYRDVALAYEAKTKVQEGELTDLRTQLASANAKIETLGTRVQTLQDMVTARSLIEAMSKTLDGNHVAVMGKAADLLALAGDIQADVGKLVSAQAGGAS